MSSESRLGWRAARSACRPESGRCRMPSSLNSHGNRRCIACAAAAASRADSRRRPAGSSSRGVRSITPGILSPSSCPGRAFPARASARSNHGRTASAPSTDGLDSKRADAVVQQERRGGPQADQRRRPRVAAAAGGHRVLLRLAGDRVIPGDLADRGQILVRLRREVIPDIAADRVRRQRTARVGVQQRHRHAEFGREIVIVQEVVGARTIARIFSLNSSVLVHSQYLFQQPDSPCRRSRPDRGPAPRRAACWNGSARSSRRTRSCRASVAASSLVRYCSPPGASFRWCGAGGLQEEQRHVRASAPR